MSLVHNMIGGGGGSKPSPTDAFLRVAAPSGSTVTIKKGTGAAVTPNFYLDGADKDEYFFYIKQVNFGTYTVTAVLGKDTAEDTITISNSEEYGISLDYAVELITNGIVNDKYEENFTYCTATTSSGARKYTLDRDAGTSLQCYFTPKIDLTNYNKITIDCSASRGSGQYAEYRCYVGVVNNITPSAGLSASKVLLDGDTLNFNRATFIVDVSELSGEFYFCVKVLNNDGRGGGDTVVNIYSATVSK